MSHARTLLSTGPFGAPDAALADLEVFLDGVETVVTGATGVTMPSVSDTDLAGASICRAALLDAFTALSRDDDEVRAVAILRRAGELLAVAPRPGAVACRVGGYLLAADWAAAPAGAHLWEIASGELSPVPHEFVPARPAHAELLADGISLLIRAAGEVGSRALDFVRGAVLVASPDVESAFLVPMPYVSVLNVSILDDPVAVADAVLHEATHQKLYDLILTRQVTRPDLDYRMGPLFAVPWKPIDGARRRMDCVRTLSALHVYAHVLHLLATAYGDALVAPDRMPALRHRLTDYVQRARFFHRVSQSPAFRAPLGVDGVAMAEWLDEIMEHDVTDVRALGLPVDSPYLDDAAEQCAALAVPQPA